MSRTPSIAISQHNRYASSPFHRSPTSAASARNALPLPMVIPRTHDAVPPPLPPPNYIPDIAHGHDPGWQWGNDPRGADFGRPASVKPGSSLLGGAPIRHCRHEKEQDNLPYRTISDARRGSSLSTATITQGSELSEAMSTPSEEDGSLSHPANYRLDGERQLGQRTLEASSTSYDKQLLSRIGGPNSLATSKQTTSPYGSASSVQETAQLAHAEAERRSFQQQQLSDQPQRLSMPERRPGPTSTLESPASTRSRWMLAAEHGPQPAGDHSRSRNHSQSQSAQQIIPPSRHGSLTFDDSVSQQRGSYDQAMFSPDDLNDDAAMNTLYLHDRSPGRSDDLQPQARAGTKRRASSPPRDALDERSSVSSTSGHSDVYHRRSSQQQTANRCSPVSRFQPHQSSLSSASSIGPRQNSLSSSLGIASFPSSVTSYGSANRLSPSALSPPAVFDPTISDTRLFAAKPLDAKVAPLNHPSRNQIQVASHQAPSDNVAHSRTSSVSQAQNAYVCECCPKKPRKFDTEEDLRIHESEKQYTCAYCPNRFKNKNEAERHQNSLHLRRHSWSCAALAGAEAAFHASSSGSNADVCGYCGEEFPNPPQWDVRAEHLNHAHKFGECNQTKKFFRADHFRQHLKHSHSGTSGKWTNVLELACMKDEPLPEKRVSHTGPMLGGQAPPALMTE